MSNVDNKLGSNKMLYELKGKKVEISIPAIGLDVHDFFEMVVDYMRATGWSEKTILSGLENAANSLEQNLDVEQTDSEEE